ncbi:hypothetical protein [Sphingorhabdus sp. EL138]|jgi:hypothetical protein|nr:hypothetical protein [Sphingorhabdus sp. EL138]
MTALSWRSEIQDLRANGDELLKPIAPFPRRVTPCNKASNA